MPRRSDAPELRRRDKIVAVQPVNDVPEGSLGEVKMVVGQAWTRYLVRWDDGRWTGTVDGSQIVRRDRLDQWRREQAAAVSTKAATATPTSAAEAVSASGVPEHLLERSRTARARWESKAS